MLMRRLFLSGMLIVGALSSTVEHGTLARFTTATSSLANQFTAGNLKISSQIASGSTLSVSGLAAGDNFDAQLNITNAGTLNLQYSMATSVSVVSGDAALGDTLQLTVRAKTSNPCSSRDGSVLSNGALSAAAFSNRALATGASEAICFTIVLPGTAGNSLQGTNVAATFTFQAVQQ